jgi:hypothetical protein
LRSHTYNYMWRVEKHHSLPLLFTLTCQLVEIILKLSATFVLFSFDKGAL